MALVDNIGGLLLFIITKYKKNQFQQCTSQYMESDRLEVPKSLSMQRIGPDHIIATGSGGVYTKEVGPNEYNLQQQRINQGWCDRVLNLLCLGLFAGAVLSN